MMISPTGPAASASSSTQQVVRPAALASRSSAPGRHTSVSPTHSSASSSATSSRSDFPSGSGGGGGGRALPTFGSLSDGRGSSGGSASWIGSDGTAATSDQGSPAIKLPPHPPVADLPAEQVKRQQPASASSSGLAPGPSSLSVEAERLRRSISTPSFRRDGTASAADVHTGATAATAGAAGKRSRERVATSPGIKRKASGGSSSARSELVEGRSIDMRRVPTGASPPTASGTTAAGTAEAEAPVVREWRAGREEHPGPRAGSGGGTLDDDDEDETMRDLLPPSPSSERKLRRRRDRAETVGATMAARFGTEPRRTTGTPPRRRKKRPSNRSPAAAAPPPASDPTPAEPEPHIDLAGYPQNDLLRLLASLLAQIASANDSLRSADEAAAAAAAIGEGSSTTTSIPALRYSSAALGSSASLASNLSTPGATTRRVVASALPSSHPQAPSSAGSTRRESRSPWNSMPSTPYHERKELSFTPLAASTATTTQQAGGSSSLSHPPTPGASRANSPSTTRRGSLNTLPALSLSEVPHNDLFSASRTALGSRSATLAFHARNVPQITIEAYLLRILKYCPTSNEVFVSLLVYFDRMARMVGLDGRPLENGVSGGGGSGGSSPRAARHAALDGSGAQGEAQDGADGKPFMIDSFNVHRLVIAGVTVASKFFSDVFYTNSRYAKVGGLPLYELDQLELQFLLINDFRLVIPLEEMQRYADQLLMHWDGARGTSGYREPRPPPISVPPLPEEDEERDDQEGDDEDDDDGDWGSDEDSDESNGDDDDEDLDGMHSSAELIAERRHVVDAEVDEAARTVSSASLAHTPPSHPVSHAPGNGEPAQLSDMSQTSSMIEDDEEEGEGDENGPGGTRPRTARSQPSASRLSVASGQSSEASASTLTPGTPRAASERLVSEDDEPFDVAAAAAAEDDVEMEGVA